jgi:methyl coenzyme M reductase subunit C-like uncharacterized protein (methanogenesis marker protein 7)
MSPDIEGNIYRFQKLCSMTRNLGGQVLNPCHFQISESLFIVMPPHELSSLQMKLKCTVLCNVCFLNT